jgi:Protein of unknown function (DUF4232)
MGQKDAANSGSQAITGRPEMKYLSTTAHRVAAVIVAASVGGLIATTAAFAASSSGAALASDTTRASTAAVHSCTADDLGVWVAVSQGNGAAGTLFLPLEFTNLSRHACAMHGFPGVSAIDRNGHQLGRPAVWDHVAQARTVVLAPGATAHSILGYSDVAVTTSPGCRPVVNAFELRVYPPGQRRATYAAFDLQACTHSGTSYLGVQPIRAGVGTISG